MTRRSPSFTFGDEGSWRASPRRWPWILAMLVLAGGGLGGFWYLNPDSQPEWWADHLPTAPSAEVRLYRWKDAGGQWVVADAPPEDGTPYEVVDVRQDTNVMPTERDDD